MKHIIDVVKASKRKSTRQRDAWKRRAMIYLSALEEIADGPCCGECEPEAPRCEVGIAKTAIESAKMFVVNAKLTGQQKPEKGTAL